AKDADSALQLGHGDEAQRQARACALRQDRRRAQPDLHRDHFGTTGGLTAAGSPATRLILRRSATTDNSGIGPLIGSGYLASSCRDQRAARGASQGART